MRAVRIFLGAVLVGAFALVVGAAPASAARSVVYQGHFAGPVSYGTCTVRPAAGPHIAGGVWSITLRQNAARGDFTITVNDEAHVAFAAPMKLGTPTGAEVFSVSMMTGAGPLTVTLEGTQMSYTISPYDYTPFDPAGAKCDFVTYHGVLDSVS